MISRISLVLPFKHSARHGFILQFGEKIAIFLGIQLTLVPTPTITDAKPI